MNRRGSSGRVTEALAVCEDSVNSKFYFFSLMNVTVINQSH
jgi:hypothetical protein